MEIYVYLVIALGVCIASITGDTSDHRLAVVIIGSILVGIFWPIYITTRIVHKIK